ncbi:hypothetical protein ALR00_200080 [Pseudomonas savastanoi pv. retacarpa]|nr:hypothetical protein ALR00_200080 [Pseudomonas savastanoi pv. retacarpa]
MNPEPDSYRSTLICLATRHKIATHQSLPSKDHIPLQPSSREARGRPASNGQAERAEVRMEARRAKTAIYGQAWFTTAGPQRARSEKDCRDHISALQTYSQLPSNTPYSSLLRILLNQRPTKLKAQRSSCSPRSRLPSLP